MSRWQQYLVGALVLGGVGFGGCTLPIEVGGVVKTMPTESMDVDAEMADGEGIEGAELTLLCPDRDEEHLARADEEGRFFVELDEKIDLQCQLQVSKSGFVPRIYEVSQICASASYEPEACGFVSLTARLVSTGGH